MTLPGDSHNTAIDGEVNDRNDGVFFHRNNPSSNDSNGNERFSQCISDGLMAVEELRQFLLSVQQPRHQQPQQQHHVTFETLQELQHYMNHILDIVSHVSELHRHDNHDNETDTHQMLLDHVLRKAIDISQTTLQLCYSEYVEPLSNDNNDDGDGDGDDDGPTTTTNAAVVVPLDEQRRVGQGCLARLTEVQIQLQSFLLVRCTDPTTITTTTTSVDGTIQLYVQFQKRTLRLRCKPHIAHLVQVRRDSREAFDSFHTTIATLNSDTTPLTVTKTGSQIASFTNKEKNNDDDDDGDDDDDNAVPVMDLSTFTAKAKQSQQQTYHAYHSPVLTTILGTAATLIHPLMSWMNHVSHHSMLPPKMNGNRESQTQELPPPPLQQQSTSESLYTMCQQSIDILNEQTQTLVRTMTDWFYEDRKSLMNCCIQFGNNELELPLASVPILLGHLNAMVDEMAYMAQILERYQTLIVASQQQHQTLQTTMLSERISTINKEILPEWIWQYSTYERILALQQWQMSISASGSAIPVCIVIGTDIYVSSCIEDAQYISTRTMDRAISTQSIDAISTVAYTIIHDIWATEHNNAASKEYSTSPNSTSCAAVYQALLDEIGCWSSESTTADLRHDHPNDIAPSPASGSQAFASALLDALDDDLGTSHNHRSQVMKTPVKAKPPSSGGTNFLSSLILSSSKDNEQQTRRQLDTLYCVWNSMFAASGACQSLANTLHDLLLDYNDETDAPTPPSSSNRNPPDGAPLQQCIASSTTESDALTKKAIAKIQLTRDDVLQYSTDYLQLLLNRIDESIDRWCCSETHQCLHQLEYYFHDESYNITDATIFQNMEQEERLFSKLIAPFEENILLQQLTTKCDEPVLVLVAERMATRVVDMILNVIWNQNNNGEMTKNNPSKKFTDWGALLLSKQSRMLQQYISTTMIQQQQPHQQQPSRSHTSAPGAKISTTSASSGSGTTSHNTPPGITATKVIQIWERLSHVVTVLQLEKPMDWITYYHPYSGSSTSSATNRSATILSPDELSQTLHLRVDFSSDAIEAVVSKLRSAGV